jgi:hypothetical protein
MDTSKLQELVDKAAAAEKLVATVGSLKDVESRVVSAKAELAQRNIGNLNSVGLIDIPQAVASRGGPVGAGDELLRARPSVSGVAPVGTLEATRRAGPTTLPFSPIPGDIAAINALVRLQGLPSLRDDQVE